MGFGVFFCLLGLYIFFFGDQTPQYYIILSYKISFKIILGGKNIWLGQDVEGQYYIIFYIIYASYVSIM